MFDRFFSGATYEAKHDRNRLQTQMGRIWRFMSDWKPHTLAEIAEATHAPEASISRQLRYLKEPRHGGYILHKRTVGARERGMYEYRLESPVYTPDPSLRA